LAENGHVTFSSQWEHLNFSVVNNRQPS